MVGVWAYLVSNGHKATIPTKDGGETPIWLFALGALATLALYTFRKSSKFKTGDANPGVIVSLNPTLLAVYTDLTKGSGEFPAVKIVKTKVTLANGTPVQVGTPIPTVSQYVDSAGRDALHWGDFEPEPAAYATNDAASLERLASTFSEDQFYALRQYLRIIPQPFEPAMYAMWSADGKTAGRQIRSRRDF